MRAMLPSRRVIAGRFKEEIAAISPVVQKASAGMVRRPMSGCGFNCDPRGSLIIPLLSIYYGKS